MLSYRVKVPYLLARGHVIFQKTAMLQPESTTAIRLHSDENFHLDFIKYIGRITVFHTGNAC